MAQSLKHKIRKLSDQYNIDSIIQTTKIIQKELKDEAVWDSMTDQEKTIWFLDVCQKLKLNTEIFSENNKPCRIIIKEFDDPNKAYFTVFFPRNGDPWHLEIGGSFTNSKRNGGIWQTAKGKNAKIDQIQQVMRLHWNGE
jgi:hypothetical protein